MPEKKKQEEPTAAEGVVDLRTDKATPLGPLEPVPAPSILGGTFAERAAARTKQVKSAEDKAVKSSSKK